MGTGPRRAFAASGAAVCLAISTRRRAGGRRKADVGRDARSYLWSAIVSNGGRSPNCSERAVAPFGRLEALRQRRNPGAAERRKRTRPPELDLVNGVNRRGVWGLQKHELQQMRTQGSGAIGIAVVGGLVGIAPPRPPITPPSTASSTEEECGR